jgi:hypothetical protein
MWQIIRPRGGRTPTRACLMTGCYPFRYGLQLDIRAVEAEVGDQCVFLPESLPPSLSPTSVRSGTRVNPRLYRSNRAFASLSAALNL